MMDFHSLIQQLTDPTTHATARQTLLELDEQAVEPLVDQFYAGVTEAQGLAILDVVSTIGGYEALALLQDVLYNHAPHESWREAAEKLLRDDGAL